MRAEINEQESTLRNSRRNIRGLLASSAHSIIICLILSGSISWAWFTEVISGPSISVQTASYGLHADVVSGNVVVTSGDYFGATDEDNYAIEVENGNVYEIILSVPKDEEGKLGYAEYGGYCIVSAGDDLHYTVPIGGEKDGVINPEEISFKMWFPGTGISRVEFVPYWGTYPFTLPTKWKDENICIDIIENGREYIVSGGDITVSGADNNQ